MRAGDVLLFTDLAYAQGVPGPLGGRRWRLSRFPRQRI